MGSVKLNANHQQLMVSDQQLRVLFLLVPWAFKKGGQGINWLADKSEIISINS